MMKSNHVLLFLFSAVLLLERKSFGVLGRNKGWRRSMIFGVMMLSFFSVKAQVIAKTGLVGSDSNEIDTNLVWYSFVTDDTSGSSENRFVRKLNLTDLRVFKDDLTCSVSSSVFSDVGLVLGYPDSSLLDTEVQFEMVDAERMAAHRRFTYFINDSAQVVFRSEGSPIDKDSYVHDYTLEMSKVIHYFDLYNRRAPDTTYTIGLNEILEIPKKSMKYEEFPRYMGAIGLEKIGVEILFFDRGYSMFYFLILSSTELEENPISSVIKMHVLE